MAQSKLHEQQMKARDSALERVVAWLSDKPDGETIYAVSRAMGWGEGHAATVVAWGYKVGTLVGIPAPNGRCRTRKLVFTAEHAKGKPAQIVNECTPMPDPMRMAAAEARENARAWPAKRRADGVLVTVAPLPVDPRYHVEKPERFFSAMTPGSYLRHDSWAARALSERQA